MPVSTEYASALLSFRYPSFMSSKFGSLKSMNEMYQKYLKCYRRVLVTKRLSDSVVRCRERKEMLRKNFGTCSLVRLKERQQIYLGIGE